VQALPLLTAFFVAIVLAPSAVAALGEGRLARVNYLGVKLPAPLGILIVAAALVALIPLGFAQQLVSSTLLRPELGWIATYVLGVAFLGLVDDALAGTRRADAAPGSAPPRGWRGHGAALLEGHFSTGALKALGAAGLALYVLSRLDLSTLHYLLAAGVLVLSTNLFNLLDLRPGRAIKALVLLGIVLTIGASDLHPLWALGVFVGPALVAGLYDVREHGMLGDTGSNIIGALAGAWLVLTLSTAGDAIALAVLAAITVYGEFRSISELVERTPGLRELDSIGRPTHAPER
jgi:UDP-N-acetylmuramyl pentapeptide phosphotransferase/UDP-N-acetylglucosamine-1-phosphate transferase